jgi:hypothetical protein
LNGFFFKDVTFCCFCNSFSAVFDTTISSIEGESSYFYDKKIDAVYEVDWGEMDDFMAGRLKPIFTSCCLPVFGSFI